MFRCAAIGDTKTWLDCYYGAAQPARAALRLAPAPDQQLHLALNPPAGGARPDNMAPRYDTTARALACNNVEPDRAWLDCYYGAAQPVRQQLGLAPAPQAMQALAPAPGMAVAAAPALDRNWSAMTAYSFDPHGMFTVTLANGQVWRQLSGDTNQAHWTGAAARYAVRVTPGFLDSFNLNVRGLAAIYKVQRLR